MPRERFVELEVLPFEFVSRLERKVQRAYEAVQDDTEQTAILTIRIRVAYSKATGDVDGEYEIETRLTDREPKEIGKIRDSQLVLPGTDIRSDESPSGEWTDKMLASPRKREAALTSAR